MASRTDPGPIREDADTVAVGWMIVLSAELNAGIFELVSPSAPASEEETVAQLLER